VPSGIRRHARHVLVRRKEIVDAQEESHATGELPPDQSHLLITSSLGEQDATAGAGRANNDPSLRLAVAVERWRIIFHDTAEHVTKNSIASSYSLTMTLTSSDPWGQTISSNRLIRWSVHYRGVMSSDWARPVVHWSIVALDPERQRSFYADLFNWEIGDGPSWRSRLESGGWSRDPRPHPGRRESRGIALRAGGRLTIDDRQAIALGGRRRSHPLTWKTVRPWPPSKTRKATSSCWCSSKSLIRAVL